MRLRVDVSSAFSLVGTLLRWMSLTLLIPTGVALLYGEDPRSFLITLAVSFLLGWGLEWLNTDPELGIREAFLVVSCSWLSVALVGAFPYVLEAQGTLAHPLNAFFESMSGFTTTGSTVMGTISLEAHGYGLMIWRQLTQWLGGMGIIVLAVAILPKLSVGGTQLIQQEAPGPSLDKLTPHIAETARRLWIIYVLLTVLETVLLYGWYHLGVEPNMNFFNAISHSLTTLPTGGFSPEGRSIEAFGPAAQWTIIPFMVLAGSNFTLLWFIWDLQPGKLLNDEEWKFFVSILCLVGGLTSILVLFTTSSGTLTLALLEESVRHGLFQVVSIVTTTGYASLDYTDWHLMIQGLLFLVMFTGASAGSTGGSVKIVRWLVALKSVGRELFVSVHSAAVRPLRIGKKIIKEKTVQSILIFFLIYALLFLGGTGVIMLDCGYHGTAITLQEASGNAATALGNVGPSFGANGPMNNFLNLPPLSRLTMALLMWLGRLEIITVLVVLSPAYWTT